jgi:hypothetical protein
MAFSSVATPEAREAARRAVSARADERALALAPIIAEIEASGITTPHAIAADLNRRGILTARGHRFWGGTQVRKVLDRLDRLKVRAEGLRQPPNAPLVVCDRRSQLTRQRFRHGSTGRPA